MINRLVVWSIIGFGALLEFMILAAFAGAVLFWVAYLFNFIV